MRQKTNLGGQQSFGAMINNDEQLSQEMLEDRQKKNHAQAISTDSDIWNEAAEHLSSYSWRSKKYSILEINSGLCPSSINWLRRINPMAISAFEQQISRMNIDTK